MNNLRSNLLVCLVMVLLFTACMPAPLGDGMIELTQAGTVLWTVQRNIGMHSGTIRMAKDSFVLVAAWMETAQAWSYVFLDVSQKAPLDYWAVSCGSGNCANPRTMSELVTSLLNNGWQIIDVLPPCIVAAFKDASSWLRAMPSVPVMIIPGAMFDIPAQILPPVGEIE
jgi:hypothetical protein